MMCVPELDLGNIVSFGLVGQPPLDAKPGWVHSNLNSDMSSDIHEYKEGHEKIKRETLREEGDGKCGGVQ